MMVLVCPGSAGAMTARPACARPIARSSTAKCVGPACPYANPPPIPTIRTGSLCRTGPLRIISYGRIAANDAMEYANGVNPDLASPVATPSRFCSATPAFTNRSGYAVANGSRTLHPRSPVTRKTLGSVAACSTSVFRNAFRMQIQCILLAERVSRRRPSPQQGEFLGDLVFLAIHASRGHAQVVHPVGQTRAIPDKL